MPLDFVDAFFFLLVRFPSDDSSMEIMLAQAILNEISVMLLNLFIAFFCFVDISEIYFHIFIQLLRIAHGKRSTEQNRATKQFIQDLSIIKSLCELFVAL